MFHENLTFYFGLIGYYPVSIILTDMDHSSVVQVLAAIGTLNFKLIIGVGVAWGMNRSKQVFGDILVSEQVVGYMQNTNEGGNSDDQAMRSAIFECSKMLKDRFFAASAQHQWPSQSRIKLKREWYAQIAESRTSYVVHFGRVISGDLLLSNSKMKDQLQLQSEYREAVGGEMDSFAVALASHFSSLHEWIIVRSICNWTVRKTSGFQPLCAALAVDFVRFVLCKRGVLGKSVNA